MTTIYICGSDLSQSNVHGLVDPDKLKTKLKSLKCKVVNPTDMAFAKMGWSNTLQSRLDLLKRSQAIYVLPNWKDNIMARIELTVAMDLKMHTLFHPISNRELKQLITSLDN